MKPITISITIESIRSFVTSRDIRHFNESDEVMFVAADKSTTYRIEQHHRSDCGAFGYSEMIVKRYEHSIDTVYDCVAVNEVALLGKETLSNFGFMHLFIAVHDPENISPSSMFLAANNQQ